MPSEELLNFESTIRVTVGLVHGQTVAVDWQSWHQFVLEVGEPESMSDHANVLP